MVKSWWIALLFAACLFQVSGTQSAQDTSRPDQIIEVFRHGARGPLVRFDHAWQKDQMGQLTEPGTRQKYILGRVLNKKYPHLVGEMTPVNQTYILSDITSRCIQSAILKRSGLYNTNVSHLHSKNPEEKGTPPFKDPLVYQLSYNDTDLQNGLAGKNGTKTVQPQVHIVDKENAAIFKRAHGSQCPNGNIWEKQNSGDERSKEAWSIFKDTIDQINSHFPKYKQLKSPFGLAVFGDAMLVNVFHNMSMESFGMHDPQAVKNFTYAYSWFVFHNEYGQEHQRQVSAFPFVDEILKKLEAFKNGEEDSKQAALYSAHDYNIYAILGAFGVISEECIMANFKSSIANETLPYPHCYFPFFASNLIFELYNKTEKAYVKLLYNNVPVPLCDGGKEACEYEEFVKFARNAVGNHTDESYKEVCGVVVKGKKKVESEGKSFLRREEIEENLDNDSDNDVTYQDKERMIVESLISSRSNSTRVSLDLSELKADKFSTFKLSNSTIVLGWIVLSLIICLLIKSRTKSVRLHAMFKRHGKKKISSLINIQDIDVKIH